MKRLLFFMILIPIFVSCVDDVNLKNLGIETKMVLYCYISPMFDTNTVFLSNSQPLLSQNADDLHAISNGIVEISKDKQTWIKFVYHAQKAKYILPSSEFPIEEGETYYIRAAAVGFDERISASCTVPYYRNINLKVDSQFVISDVYNTVDLNFTWRDYKGESNYYTLTVYDFYENEYEEGEYQRLIYSNNVYDEKGRDFLFADTDRDGKEMKAKYSLVIDEYQDNNFDTVCFNVVQMDEPNYLHLNSLLKYYGSIDFMGMVEPVLIYNNVENGYGLFAAIVFKSYRFILKDEILEEY